ncbi:DUF4126 family protein [Sandarakinorhabdus glacialis]|nr:DUF4126 family protein [Polymorphobacter glacialis]
MGAIAGARSMTPLAAVSLAAKQGLLPRNNGAQAFLSHPVVVAGSLALAAGELAGDKMESAPDRIVVAGLAARLMTGAIAGAALAPRDERLVGGLLGAAAAVAASYVTFELRMRALRRYGQTASGVVEDALVVGSALLIVAVANDQEYPGVTENENGALRWG